MNKLLEWYSIAVLTLLGWLGVDRLISWLAGPGGRSAAFFWSLVIFFTTTAVIVIGLLVGICFLVTALWY